MTKGLDAIKRTLDVALLTSTATTREIEAFGLTLVQEGYYYMGVNPCYTKLAADVVKGSQVNVVACVGFPFHTAKTATKVFETEQCVIEGADEIDMVIDLGGILGGDYRRAEDDIRAVVKAAAGLPVKVIIEISCLNYEQKRDTCLMVKSSGATFIKTDGGATHGPVTLFEDVRLIRQIVGPEMRIKASGRVGNFFRYQSMMEAGADRIGLDLDEARRIIRGWEEAGGERK